jgi:hypothetical protein
MDEECGDVKGGVIGVGMNVCVTESGSCKVSTRFLNVLFYRFYSTAVQFHLLKPLAICLGDK